MRSKWIVLLIALQMAALAGCSIPAALMGTTSSSSGPSEGKGTPANYSEGTIAGVHTEENTETAVSTAAEPVAKAVAKDGSAVEGGIAATLYYQDANGILVPVTRWLERQQGIARAALQGLVDSAASREELEYYGLYPVLPSDAGILGINIRDGIATVDFDRNGLKFRDKTAERNMLVSVVYTLTGFKTIDGVRILVNGYEQKELDNGTSLSGVFTRDNLWVNAETPGEGTSRYKADIFLLERANDTFTYYVPVSVALPAGAEDGNPLKKMEALLQAKTEGNLRSEIPAGTKVLKADAKDGVLTVDFSKAMLQYGGNSREDAIVRQVLYTAGQMDGIEKVRILVGGKAAEFPEGTDAGDVVGVPGRINDIMDKS